MGRPRKYVSLEEATRERNARRRRQRANASAHANSREYRDTAARTRLSVPIEQPSNGPSSVELRCKSMVNIDTEGVSGRDGHHVLFGLALLLQSSDARIPSPLPPVAFFRKHICAIYKA